jgi:hypothetical protein
MKIDPKERITIFEKPLKYAPAIIEKITCRHFRINPCFLHLPRKKGNERREISDSTRACMVLFKEFIPEMMKRQKIIGNYFGLSIGGVCTGLKAAKNFEQYDNEFRAKIQAARSEIKALNGKKHNGNIVRTL